MKQTTQIFLEDESPNWVRDEPKQHLKLNLWKTSATLKLSWKKSCL